MTSVMIPGRARARAATLALALILGAGLAGCAGDSMLDGTLMASDAAGPVQVGGAPMYASKTIVENAVNSADHTTLVAAVKQAGLVDALSGPGPFTVFAPTNAAFDALPAGTVEGLMAPSARAQLAGVLTYHVVPGRLTRSELMARIRAGGGKATLTTLAGGMLTARMNGPDNIVIADAGGRTADISTYDVLQSNGVIQVIDHVLIPQG
ncbi:fasciclin domain-containing protein [Tistrella mobilis]|uniref:fasciclin domain-containing protein n=1 Tax=Tistrella mobilis TaxID=171437 RepID=UPI00355704DA